MIDEPIIGLLEETWRSISSLGHQLDENQWSIATDCPGWSTKDIISHLIAIERQLLGLPGDPPLAAYPDYVKNDIGRFGENTVEARRPLAGATVLAEFDQVTADRIAMLQAMTDADFEKIGWSPIGDVAYRQFMTVRLFDSWIHEQDIRRAVGRPGHLTGPVVDAVLAWHRRSLGFVVGKRAKAPDGSVVVFDVTEPTPAHEIVEVSNGRASVVATPSHAPDTILHVDTETYNALLAGRWTTADALANQRLTIDGDRPLGTQVADAMGYVF